MLPLSKLIGRNWPGIPDDGRVIRADQGIEFVKNENGITVASLDREEIRDRNQRERLDAASLCDWYNAQAYRKWGLTRIAADHGKLKDPNVRIAKMIQIGRNGDKNSVFALAVQTTRMENGRNVSYIDFDLASRDPEWTGFSPVWAKFRNLAVAVLESEKEEGKPGVVVGLPPGASCEIARNRLRFPEGDAAAVEKILYWHGAESVRWFYAKNRDNFS